MVERRWEGVGEAVARKLWHRCGIIFCFNVLNSVSAKNSGNYFCSLNFFVLCFKINQTRSLNSLNCMVFNSFFWFKTGFAWAANYTNVSSNEYKVIDL